MTLPYHALSRDHTVTISVFAAAQGADSTEKILDVKLSSLADLRKFFCRTVERRRKQHVPLYSRGLCDGPRKKQNLVPPFLVILDVDKSKVPLTLASKRLREAGVHGVGHHTWSHVVSDEPTEHSYRIITDIAAESWEQVERLTRELFDVIDVEPTPESWTCPAFFVPAQPSPSHEESRRGEE